MNNGTLTCSNTIKNPSLQFIPLKNIGVIEGTDCTTKLCLDDIKISASDFTSVSMRLPAGITKKLNIDNIADFGLQKKVIELYNAEAVNGVIEIKVLNKVGDVIDILVTDSAGQSHTDAYADIIDALNTSVAKDFITISGSMARLIFTGKSDGFDFQIEATYATVPKASIIVYVASRYPAGALKFLVLTIEWDSDVEENERFLLYLDEKDKDSGSTNWKPLHQILMMSGAEDIEHDDTNKINTIYIKNTQSFDVNVSGLIGA